MAHAEDIHGDCEDRLGTTGSSRVCRRHLADSHRRRPGCTPDALSRAGRAARQGRSRNDVAPRPGSPLTDPRRARRRSIRSRRRTCAGHLGPESRRHRFRHGPSLHMPHGLAGTGRLRGTKGRATVPPPPLGSVWSHRRHGVHSDPPEGRSRFGLPRARSRLGSHPLQPSRGPAVTGARPRAWTWTRRLGLVFDVWSSPRSGGVGRRLQCGVDRVGHDASPCGLACVVCGRIRSRGSHPLGGLSSPGLRSRHHRDGPRTDSGDCNLAHHVGVRRRIRHGRAPPRRHTGRRLRGPSRPRPGVVDHQGRTTWHHLSPTPALLQSACLPARRQRLGNPPAVYGWRIAQTLASATEDRRRAGRQASGCNRRTGLRRLSCRDAKGNGHCGNEDSPPG